MKENVTPMSIEINSKPLFHYFTKVQYYYFYEETAWSRNFKLALIETLHDRFTTLPFSPLSD